MALMRLLALALSLLSGGGVDPGFSGPAVGNPDPGFARQAPAHLPDPGFALPGVAGATAGAAPGAGNRQP